MEVIGRLEILLFDIDETMTMYGQKTVVFFFFFTTACEWHDFLRWFLDLENIAHIILKLPESCQVGVKPLIAQKRLSRMCLFAPRTSYVQQSEKFQDLGTRT